MIDPNNPTGASYPLEIRRALVELADRHNFVLLADEVYADLAFDGPVPAIAAGYPDAPIISFSSLSKAYLAPGWRAGWMAVGSTPRMDDALGAIKKLADGRLCATGPMEHAIAPRSTATGRTRWRSAPRCSSARRTDNEPPQRHRRDYGGAADCRLLRDAASGASARQDRRGLRPGAPARNRRSLRLRLGVWHAAGRRVLPHRLPCRHPQELSGIYDDIASFTRTFLDAG